MSVNLFRYCNLLGCGKGKPVAVSKGVGFVVFSCKGGSPFFCCFIGGVFTKVVYGAVKKIGENIIAYRGVVNC